MHSSTLHAEAVDQVLLGVSLATGISETAPLLFALMLGRCQEQWLVFIEFGDN